MGNMAYFNVMELPKLNWGRIMNTCDISIKELIEEQRFEHVYQPLWDLSNWKIFGYESLIRIVNGGSVHNIEHLFQMAREQGCLYELDTTSIKNSIFHFPFSKQDKKLLFLNIYPSTILHDRFKRFLNDLVAHFPAIEGQIVFELNETKDEEEVWEISELKERIRMIKEYGFYLAIDDVGKGASALQKIIEFQPDYIKLDRYFAKDLAMNKEKQRIVALLASYCQEKIVLVLEGIEKEVDLAQAKLLKVPAAQGYLLGKPHKLEKPHKLV
jgi:EAL domain-containing protein (putative c-di-GMP-specific phosphodiesterase class I)